MGLTAFVRRCCVSNLICWPSSLNTKPDFDQYLTISRVHENPIAADSCVGLSSELEKVEDELAAQQDIVTRLAAVLNETDSVDSPHHPTSFIVSRLPLQSESQRPIPRRLRWVRQVDRSQLFPSHGGQLEVQHPPTRRGTWRAERDTRQRRKPSDMLVALCSIVTNGKPMDGHHNLISTMLHHFRRLLPPVTRLTRSGRKDYTRQRTHYGRRC